MTPEQQIREALGLLPQAVGYEERTILAFAALDRLVAERDEARWGLESATIARRAALTERDGYLRDFLAARERSEAAEGREAALREAAALVVLLDERERAGDETLSGHEWGEAMAKLAAACSVHALAAVPAADPPQDKAVT